MAITAFKPEEHGFKFYNYFTLLGIPYGLCGGMCYAALDYWHAGIPIPTVTVPPPWLHRYLIKRQVHSTHPLKVWQFMRKRDAQLASWSHKQGERIKRHIDAGEPVVLLLIRAKRAITQNHQVVATGYDAELLYLYDPNHGLAAIELDTLTQTTGEPLRGFYVQRYKRMVP